MKQIILASSSPRRKELLRLLDLPFISEAADIDEILEPNLTLSKQIEKLSFQKAMHIFNKHNDALIIAADTVVCIDSIVLGKPKNYQNAKEMLTLIQNKTHQVITAVTLLDKEKSDTFSSLSKVTFYPMSEAEIIEYAGSGEGFDKAGAYALQGKGARYIKAIEGDYYAIVGLPVAQVYHRIKKYL